MSTLTKEQKENFEMILGLVKEYEGFVKETYVRAISDPELADYPITPENHDKFLLITLKIFLSQN